MGMNSKGKKFADINVTPMVDVMLVLLVIFMITAPLMLNGIKLKLPKTKEVNRLNISHSQVVLSITKNEEYYLGKTLVKNENITKLIKSKINVISDVLYLRADFSLKYGKVAKIMSSLKNAGIKNIALVTEISKK